MNRSTRRKKALPHLNNNVAYPEIIIHKSVNDWVHEGIGHGQPVGHEVEVPQDLLEVTVRPPVHVGDLHNQNEGVQRQPAQTKEGDDGYQHLHHL